MYCKDNSKKNFSKTISNIFVTLVSSIVSLLNCCLYLKI
uniref:Lipoprotein n=1 Tax=Geladintestivirus 2 TaxID=3233134 RepID=A0AAU8MHX8_9CAUD